MNSLLSQLHQLSTDQLAHLSAEITTILATRVNGFTPPHIHHRRVLSSGTPEEVQEYLRYYAERGAAMLLCHQLRAMHANPFYREIIGDDYWDNEFESIIEFLTSRDLRLEIEKFDKRRLAAREQEHTA